MAAVIAQVSACQNRATGTLQERVAQYWELRQQKRWEAVYDGYLDPTLKASLTKDAFLKKRQLAFDILSFSVSSATENENDGTVRVTAEANIPLRLPGQDKVQIRKDTITSEESWVRRDGVWYVHVTE